MVFTKEQLLARLQELQISFSQYEHPVVLTVEAQAEYVGNMKGALSKNLFLKDKKHRYYVVSALANTKVDLKVLSQRLGLGKGGLRMAPEEALSEILHVPLGCVTPFALVNESARCVSLLLDKGFKTEECCFFHPLSNDMSIALNARDLDKFLNSIGKFPAYVDLEATPTVGKDQPPDLASLVPSDVTVLSNPPEKKESSPGPEKNHISANKQPVISAGPNPAKPSNASTTEKTSGPNPAKPSNASTTEKTSGPNPAKPSNASSTEKTSGTVNMAITYADTDKFVEEILEKTRTMILSEIKEEENLEKYREQLATILSNNISNRLGAELKNLATIFKNKAYTEGFKASIHHQPKRM